MPERKTHKEDSPKQEAIYGWSSRGRKEMIVEKSKAKKKTK